MSRWFRHYAGMVRDDKLVRASIKSKQSIERVVWVWSAILESAAEIDDGGRYEIDHDEMARFLRCPASKLADIEHALVALDRVHEGTVAKWSNRQFQSDKSAARTKRYRDARKGAGDDRSGTSRDADVTSQERHRDAPETETETDTSVANATASPNPEADPDKIFWDGAKAYLGKSKASKIGQWVRDHGREQTAAAIAAAQVERAVEPVSFIEGRFRRLARAGEREWISPC
jgi:hypothetical protein